jgi:hypothetical protein
VAPASTPPSCTIRFDDLSGCGINVTQRESDAFRRVELAFVSEGDQEMIDTVTDPPAEQLRAALDHPNHGTAAGPRPSPRLRANAAGRHEAVNDHD